uniref:VOC family protein n=1 Tax=uncultured Sphingomonas sp. TaxID=158754 RepID=UPI0035CC12CF
MRFVLVIAASLALSFPAEARPAAPEVPSLSLDHVGIQAADLDRSVAFYTQVLGLREVPAPFPPAAARWLALGGGRMLHIVAHGTRGAPHNPWDHFALACADLNMMTKRLDALNVAWTDMDGKRGIQTRPDHVRQIFVRDPDGYDIEINDAK